MAWTLRQLEVFVTVADAGSLSSAAGLLGAAQPAVSITMRNLERATATRLFNRSAAGVTLTREGREFLEHARVIIAQADKAQRHLKELRGLERGELVLGAPTMVASTFLPDLTATFMKRHPGVTVRIVQDGADAIADRVRRAEFELGFIADRGRHPHLASVLLERHPMDACVASSSPLARKPQLGWAELLACPLIVFPRDYHQRSRLEDVASKLRIQPNVVAETESVGLMLSLVRAGRGVATLLRASAAGVPGVTAVPLPPGTEVPVALCYRKDLVLSHTAKAFLALAKSFKSGVASRS